MGRHTVWLFTKEIDRGPLNDQSANLIDTSAEIRAPLAAMECDK